MLTKTQTELLQSAARNPHGIVSVSSGVVTSRKRKRYGQRVYMAASKLVELGLLKFEQSYRGTKHLSHGFGSDIGSERIYSITEKGKEKT